MSEPVTRPELEAILKLIENGMDTLARKMDEVRAHVDVALSDGKARMDGIEARAASRIDQLDARLTALENDAREERAARKALVNAGRIIWGLLGAGGGGALFWIAGLISKGLHP